MVHSAQFTSETARTPIEWRQWFNDTPGTEKATQYKTLIEYIYARSILPGIAIRTAKNWGIQRWIGFTVVHHDLHKPENAKMDRKRHKAKSQRRARG